MKKTILLSILVAMISALFMGCCPCRKGKNNLSLEGREWHLVRMMNHDLQISAEQFTFTFAADGEFSGMGACNRIFGKYTISDKRDMTFSDMASTKRMCPDAELEAAFHNILSQTTHYEIDGDMLMLLSNGDMQAVLKAVTK